MLVVGPEDDCQGVGPRVDLWRAIIRCESEVKIDRLKFRMCMTVVGLLVTYPAVRETFSLRYYSKKAYKSIGYPFFSEGLSIN